MRRILLGALLAGMVLFSAAATRTPGTFVGGSGGASYSPVLALPDTVFLASDTSGGRQFNLYFDQMGQQNIYGPLPVRWAASVTGSVGSVSLQDSLLRMTPAATTRTSGTVTITGLDASGNALVSASTVLHTVYKGAGTDSVRVLMIGDSIFQGGGAAASSPPDSATTGELRRLANYDGGLAGGAHFNFIGTKGNWVHKHEAEPNRRWADLAGAGVLVANPFWYGGRNDFQHYLTTNSFAAPKYVVVGMGINDVGWEVFMGGTLHFWTDADIAIRTGHIDDFVDALNEPTYGIPGAQILLVTMPLGAATMDGFSASEYSPASNPDYARYWYYNLSKLNKAIMDRYSSRRYAANVHVCAAHLWVDRRHGYPASKVNISSRSTEKRTAYTQWIHPGPSGYHQMMDAIYSHLRYLRTVAELGPAGNLLAESEDFTHASWQKVGNSTAGTSINDPDGNPGAQVWVTGSSGQCYFTTGTGPDGKRFWTYSRDNVLSCYFKAASATTIRCALDIGYSYFIIFTVTQAGAVTLVQEAPANYFTTGEGDWGYTDEGDGWVRVWIYRPMADASIGFPGTAGVWDRPSGTSASIQTAMWGAHLERGVKTPSAYQEK